MNFPVNTNTNFMQIIQQENQKQERNRAHNKDEIVVWCKYFLN